MVGDPAVTSPVAGSTLLTVLVVTTLEFSDSEVNTSSVLSWSLSWPGLVSLSLVVPGRQRAESEEQLENWNREGVAMSEVWGESEYHAGPSL